MPRPRDCSHSPQASRSCDTTSSQQACYQPQMALYLPYFCISGLPLIFKNDMRPFVWSIFLNVSPHSPAKYISHLAYGPSPLAHKIRNDTPRTLATDPLFRKRVTEGMLRRLLNAFDWSMSKRNKGIRYVQGMNVLAAPFLYVCGGEAECMAFGLFEKFITIECPVYVRPTLEGVHRGLKVCSLDIATHSISYLTFVCTELNQSYTTTFVQRNFKQSYTRFHVISILVCF
jgi:Rab-GTPase-TBC domain